MDLETLLTSFAAMLASVVVPAVAYHSAKESQLHMRLGAVLGAAVVTTFILRYLYPAAFSPWIGDTYFMQFDPHWGWLGGLLLIASLTAGMPEARRKGPLIFLVALTCWSIHDATTYMRELAHSLRQSPPSSKPYLQSTRWSCAPAAGVALLNELSIDSSELELGRLMRTRRESGTSLLHTQRGLTLKLRPHSLRALLVKDSYDTLVDSRYPALARVRLPSGVPHMIAILEAREKSLTVMDPQLGVLDMPRADFEARSDGNLIVIRPSR